MYLYNNNTKQKENFKTKQYRDENRKAYLLEKITDTQLNDLGLYKIAIVGSPTPANHQKIEIQVGSIINGLWTEPKVLVDLPIEDLRTKLKNQLKTKSNEVEIGGITVGEIEVDTTEAGQSKLSNAAFFSDKNPNKELSYPSATGWQKVTNAQLLAIHDAVGNHKSNTYDNEMAHDIALDSADLATLQSYDISTGW